MPRDGEKKGSVASGTKCNVWVIGCAVIGPDTGHLVGVIERNSAFVMCVVTVDTGGQSAKRVRRDLGNVQHVPFMYSCSCRLPSCRKWCSFFTASNRFLAHRGKEILDAPVRSFKVI